MIQNINNKFKIIFYLLFFTFFSCKKVSSVESEKKITENIITKKQATTDTWKFFKIFSLSPQSNYSCDYKKYENVNLGLSQDSIFINGKHTDDVYTNLILSTSYFDHKYLYETYKKRLKEELDINFPLEIKSIRNKKSYDKTSLLNNYFENAFFIQDYMFFDDNGCIVCFKKANISSTSNDTSKIPKLISKEDFDSTNSKFTEINKKIIVDDSEATTVYQISDHIFIAWFDGDNERWYLVTYNDNKPVSQLLIGKNETIESENGTIDNYIDFCIDQNFKISLDYSTGKDINSKKLLRTEKYVINSLNYKIEKFK